MIDWNAIKTEYITTDTSYRKLAEKYGISPTSVSQRGCLERWRAQRAEHQGNTVNKALDRISDRQALKFERMEELTDRLLEKLETAIEELDLRLVRQVQKTKEIEYGDTDSGSKPVKEVVREEEQVVKTETIVDRRGLKQLASALRDLKEVQMLKDELDRREQEARIGNLQKQASAEKEDSAVEVVFDGDAEAYSECALCRA